MSAPDDLDTTTPPRRIRIEIWIVLGLSLLPSAVYAIVQLFERYLKEAPIGQQTQTLNPSLSTVNVIDLVFQVLRIGFRIVPVFLGIYLLWSPARSGLQRLGLSRPTALDLRHAVALAACIGLPGLALYAVGRAIGQTVRLDTSGLPDQWWSATILMLSAASFGLLEETVVVGYLLTRLRDLTWGPVPAILASALLRGSYHLYQGWPMALGNAVMGAVFGWYFWRTRRVVPLIAAHALLDVVSFVGPEFAPDAWLEFLNAN